MRPSGSIPARNFHIFDHNRRFHGTLMAGAYFASEVDPGEYDFFVNIDLSSASACKARVSRGLTYFIEVDPSINVPKTVLRGLRPGTERYEKLVEGRLPKMARFDADREAGELDISRNPNAYNQMIVAGLKRFNALEAADREERTLYASDGVRR